MFFNDKKEEKKEPSVLDDLADLFGWNTKETEEEKKIKELKNQGLNDEEIRLVMEEGYQPYDFEDDPDGDFEDDDYYGEDDL